VARRAVPLHLRIVGRSAVDGVQGDVQRRSARLHARQLQLDRLHRAVRLPVVNNNNNNNYYYYYKILLQSVYLSSYVLRILVQQRIRIADRHYNGTARARDALLQYDVSLYEAIRDEIFHDADQPAYSYFMKACTSTTTELAGN